MIPKQTIIIRIQVILLLSFIFYLSHSLKSNPRCGLVDSLSILNVTLYKMCILMLWSKQQYSINFYFPINIFTAASEYGFIFLSLCEYILSECFSRIKLAINTMRCFNPIVVFAFPHLNWSHRKDYVYTSEPI